MNTESWPKPKQESEAQTIEKKTDPKDLLLTPEEARTRGYEGNRYFVSAQNDEQEIFVVGSKHTNQIGEVQDIERALTEFNPDIILTEARPLEEHFSGKTLDEILEMDPQDVIDHQEQIYLTWLAKKQGRNAQSWDKSGLDQIIETLNMMDKNGGKKHTQDTAIAWLATYGMRKLYEDGKIPSYKALYELITFAVPGVEKLLDLTEENINRMIIKETGRSLDEFTLRAKDAISREEDQKLVTDIPNPQISAFTKDKDLLRDKHAIDVIQNVKQKGYKKIFVTAGSSHAVIWEKAIKAIFSK
jgi:hypothetical protein